MIHFGPMQVRGLAKETTLPKRVQLHPYYRVLSSRTNCRNQLFQSRRFVATTIDR